MTTAFAVDRGLPTSLLPVFDLNPGEPLFERLQQLFTQIDAPLFPELEIASRNAVVVRH